MLIQQISQMLLGLHAMVSKEDTIFKCPHQDDVIEGDGAVVSETIAIAGNLKRRVAMDDGYRALMGLQV